MEPSVCTEPTDVDRGAMRPLSIANIDSAQLRSVFLGRMREVPGAVAVIATAHKGQRGGLIATAWCSLSADPPTLLVCVNRTASAHDAIAASRRFSVNQLAAAHSETIAIFSAQRKLAGDERFKAGEWIFGKSGAPMLRDAITAYECEVVNEFRYETHSVFIGRVTSMSIAHDNSEPATHFRGVLCTSLPIQHMADPHRKEGAAP
jgi:flavin reductase (DIM6/NTAB) family NADH-FMN oxidoreductase RutF